MGGGLYPARQCPEAGRGQPHLHGRKQQVFKSALIYSPSSSIYICTIQEVQTKYTCTCITNIYQCVQVCTCDACGCPGFFFSSSWLTNVEEMKDSVVL